MNQYFKNKKFQFANLSTMFSTCLLISLLLAVVVSCGDQKITEILAGGFLKPKPDITIKSPLPGFYAESSLQVSGTAEAFNGEISEIEFSFDNASWKSCDGNKGVTWTCQIDVSGFEEEGEFDYYVRSRDEVGLYSDAAKRNFVHGSSIYVSSNGDDEGTGSRFQPVASIAKGLVRANEYNARELRILAGVYYENLVVTGDIAIKGSYCDSDWVKQDVNDPDCITSVRTGKYANSPVIRFIGADVTADTTVDNIEFNYKKKDGESFLGGSVTIVSITSGASPHIMDSRIINIDRYPGWPAPLCDHVYTTAIQADFGSQPVLDRLWIAMGNFDGHGVNTVSVCGTFIYKNHYGISSTSDSHVTFRNSILHIYKSRGSSSAHVGISFGTGGSVDVLNNTIVVDSAFSANTWLITGGRASVDERQSRVINNIMLMRNRSDRLMIIGNGGFNGYSEIKNNLMLVGDGGGTGIYRWDSTEYNISNPTIRQGRIDVANAADPEHPLTMENNIYAFNVPASANAYFAGDEPIENGYSTDINFQLKVGSAAIDAGLDLSTDGLIDDLLQKERPIGAGWDIGAYENF